MTRPRPGAALSLLAALPTLAAGCRSYWPLSEELQERIEAEASFGPSIEDDPAVVRAGRAVAEGAAAWSADFAIPPETGLSDLVEIALARNPSIRARVRDLQALGLRVPQVTSLPDPRLSIMPPTGRMTQTAAGEVQAAFGLAQAIPFPPKLAARGEVAERIVHVAFENLRSERLRVVAAVKQAYFDFYYAEMAIGVTRESEGLLRRLRDVAEARYRAGTAQQQDLLRAEVDLYRLSNEILTLQQRRDTARARLNSLLDRDVRAPLPAPRPFDPREFGWRLDGLLERAAERNPALAALRERARVNLEARELALLQYYPDIDVGGLWTLITGGISPVSNGQDVLGLTLGVRLPIWRHRIRAGVLESNANVLAIAERYRGVRNELFYAIQDRYARIDSAYRRAVLFRDAILPRARQTVAVSEASYRAGKVEFLTLVDNWRKLLDLTLEYHDAVTELERSFADMEELVGGDLSRAREDRGTQEQER